MKFMNYEIKFGIEATTKSGILKKIKEIQQSSDDEVRQSNGDFVDDIEMMLNMVPEFLLVGLQKRHKDEFGYDYNTNKGKEEATAKVCELIDEYTDQEDSSIKELFEELLKEVMQNGFFKKEVLQMKAEKEAKRAKNRVIDPIDYYDEKLLPYFLCVTQQYGFTAEKIGDMCPCELKPYELAYKLHQQQVDMQNHMLGRYVRMSILSTLGNSQWFKGKHTPPFEYPDMPFLQQEAKKSKTAMRSQMRKSQCTR